MDTSNILMQVHQMRGSGGLCVVAVRDASHPMLTIAGQWYPVSDSGTFKWAQAQIETNRDELIKMFEQRRNARMGRH